MINNGGEGIREEWGKDGERAGGRKHNGMRQTPPMGMYDYINGVTLPHV